MNLQPSRYRLFASLCLFASALTVTSQALAWGAKGHQIVAFVGADNTSGEGQAFWSANDNGFRQLTTVPDRVWKAPSTKPQEAPNHWFQVDSYFGDSTTSEILSFPKAYADAVSKYGESVVVTNGTGPWRIMQLYRMAVDAFKSGDNKAALEYAGAMSHYIGDLSQPLHVSENYDGQKTGNTGIHSWFETQNITDEMAIRSVVAERTQILLKDPQFQMQLQGDLMDVLLNEVSRSILYRDQILKNDTSLGRKTPEGKAAQLDLAEDRMADGAAVLATVLDRLWRDAGVSLNATPVPIEDPSWVTNDYAGLTPLAQGRRQELARQFTPLNPRDLHHDDDCSEE